MTKKVIIWAVIIVILAVAVYFIFIKKNDDLDSYLSSVPTKNITAEPDKINYVYDFLSFAEDGYANIKGDSGGETYAGISRVYHPNWSGWAYIDNVKKTKGKIAWKTKFPELAPSVKQFFINVYWKPFNLNYIDDVRIALLAADTIYGSHKTAMTAAVKELYGANLTVYQLLTPSNIREYLNNPPDKDKFINKVLQIRKARYEQTATGKNAQFAEGWQNRLINLKNKLFS